jgi:DNA-binding NarL/FixJ family response regulator
MEPIRVLIADDHPFFRDGVRVLLDSLPDTAVVGEAATGDEVIARAAELQPDVILMDLQMPGVNGIDATRRILRASPHIGILVVKYNHESYAAIDPIIRRTVSFDIVRKNSRNADVRSVMSINSSQ